MQGEERIKRQRRLAGRGHGATGPQGGWGPATCREPHTFACLLLYLKAPGGDLSSQ